MATKENEDSLSIVKLVDYTISICRVCTLSTECQNIFEMNYYSDLTFADLFYYSTRIQLSDDDNPYHICLMCVGKLLNAYEFIIQCEKSWYAQKQVRQSAQLEMTPKTTVPNIVIVNSDKAGGNAISQLKSIIIPKYYKPIVPKPATTVLNLAAESTGTPIAASTETHGQVKPLQKIILVSNGDGFIRDTIKIKIENATQTTDKQNVKDNVNMKRKRNKTEKEPIVNEEITINVNKTPTKQLLIAKTKKQNKDVHIEIVKDKTPINKVKVIEDAVDKEDASINVDSSPIQEEDVRDSDNESDIFKDILEELAEAEIDSNDEGSDDDSNKGNKEELDAPPYKCVRCGREFQKIHALNRHLLGHLSSRGYHCRPCEQDFPNQIALKKHHVEVHTPKRRMICEHCGKTFKDGATLRHHQKSQHSPKVKTLDGVRNCPICSLPVTSIQELKAHISSVHAEKDQLCNVCGKTFLGLANLKKHILRHDERRRVNCSICDKTFSSRESLRQHIYTHTGVKPYQCHICGKRCTQSQQLKAHIRVHTGDKPYTCTYCSNTFTTSASLMTHIRALHTHVRPHVCEVCGKGFIHKPALTKHLQTHTQGITKNKNGEYIYSVTLGCSLCGLSFPTRGALLTHKCTHMHLAPYACEICTKRFRVKQLLTVHMRIHTGERPFKCKFCSQAFRSKTSLKEHTYRHTGEKRFVCDICGKGCTQRQQLVSHMRIHTGAKPYKCDVCGKAFSMKGNLTVHVRTHTGETPYMCGDCGSGFYASNALRRHQTKCTGQCIIEEYANVPDERVEYYESDDGETGSNSS